MCYNNDGSLLSSCSNDSTIRIFDTKEYKLIKTLRGHEHKVCSIKFKNELLYSCSWDSTIKVWNSIVGNCILTLSDLYDNKRIRDVYII